MLEIKSIADKEQEIIDSFSLLEGDLEMSNIYLIERGNKLPLMDENLKLDENLVKGCQSKVWLFCAKKDNRLHFQADSNTSITKGLVSLLLDVFSNQTAEDILASNPTFIEKAGLNRFIGTQRSNGLLSMIKQIKIYALVLQTKEKI